MVGLVGFLQMLQDSGMQNAPEKVAGSNVYIVMVVTLIVWFGVFFYLMYLSSKLKKIKQQLDVRK